MRSLSVLIRRVSRLEAERAEYSSSTDPEVFRWYAPSCPCGLPPGECTIHPRARANQRPPSGDWHKWFIQAGRGFGKNRAAHEYIRWRIEKGLSRRVALVACTAADCRDTIVEGVSGFLEISPPNFRPTYEPSKRRLTWPNGARAYLYSAEEPNRLRGPAHDLALADEIAAWKYPQTWDMLQLGLRLGKDPHVLVSSTPKNVPLVHNLVKSPGVKITRGSTFDNRLHLAGSFLEQVTNTYDGTRLGDQELYGELSTFSEATWFQGFDKNRHVAETAECDPNLPVYLAIDAGVSRSTGAIWFQSRMVDQHRYRINVFGDYYCEGAFSAENAQSIKALKFTHAFSGTFKAVYLDPAADARSGTGPAAANEYRHVFGQGVVSYWPRHRVLDGLEHIEILLGRPGRDPDLVIHPRCEHLIRAFAGYERACVGGVYLDQPRDPNHPAEDLMDALRGGITALHPTGRVIKPQYRRVHIRDFF